MAGVINWSLAAPLFSINYVLLDSALQRSLRPIKSLVSPQGVEGLVEQAVRVMRWGLWMAPIINSFLRQSPDPTWYNQDGAVRTAGRDRRRHRQPESRSFRQFSLMMFIGLLAYDWLRVLIWFDHMGLRVATLVNLSFLGGDRADEAAGALRRLRRANARDSRRHSPLRHLGAAADPLLHSARRGMGQGLDGRRGACARAARPCRSRSRRSPSPMPPRSRSSRGGALVVSQRPREKRRRRRPWLAGAPVALGAPARALHRSTMARSASKSMRDGRGAAFVMGAERGGGPIDLTRRPLDPLQARGQFFYISEEGEAPWSIGYEPARRAGDYRVEETGFNRLAIVQR